MSEDYNAAQRELEIFVFRKRPYGCSDEPPRDSWYCDQCAVEVYERRCPHCGKTRRERS